MVMVMLKFSLAALLLTLTAYVTLTAMLYFLQRRMIYYPTPPVLSREAETVWLSHAGEKLKIWHVPSKGKKAILYFGGNAEDVALNLGQFLRLFPDHALYLMNYRGYGGSSGSPSEAALLADAIAFYDFAAEQYPDITVIGRSLGTGVAVPLADQRPVTRIVLITPFDSMANLAAQIYPYFPVRLLLRDHYDSLGRAPSLDLQTLVLIADDDEVIPRERTDALIAAMKPENARVTVIPNTGHNTISGSADYERELSDFIRHKPQ